MLTCRAIGVSFAWLLSVTAADAAIYGTVAGTVQDPQRKAVPAATVTVQSPQSGWKQAAETDPEGRFSMTAVPAGEYTLVATKPGFDAVNVALVVRSGTVTPLEVVLPVTGVSETVHVAGDEGAVNPRGVTTESLVTREQIDRTPGALKANSLEVVTQFVPGAYMVHDQLHVRGGHQIAWLVDGVPVPNTSIASNVGPQFDPKDIETIEIQRGGYSAEFGERMYGVFNVVPRSGFERNREAEVLASYGTLNETDNQVSLGDHTDRFAYYGSVSGNRTDFGLEPPVAESIHNDASGVSGFASLIFKSSPTDQFRVVSSVRGDHYEVPNTPEDEALGIDDHQRERDAFVNVSWMHTIGTSAFLTVSPFYHYNRARYDGGAEDPIVTTDHRTSQYFGAQATVAMSKGRHDARVGAYAYHQRDEALFGLESPDDATAITETDTPTGHVEVAFAQEQFAANGWLTINAGVRATHFAGEISEGAVDPRVGVAFRLPHEWAARAFVGRYYQPPPLTTVSGPLLEVAAEEGFGFLPLKGERDTQYEVGLAVPIHGWTLDADYFHTEARNFFDHDALGNSNIFIPLTIDQARIRGFEATLRGPQRGPLHVHAAYSHQYVQGRGGVSGGLTDFAPPEDSDYFYLDHDQRNTITGGADVTLRRGAWVSGTLAYGSGFLQGDGPDHMPDHVEFNLQAGKSFGDRWTIVASALNVADTRYLLDESNTFGGTHYNSPRQFSVGMRYRFHY
jgi:outer membrane cobalamin receptor